MNVHIAIETSTRVGSVAVSRGGERRRADLGESRAHASDLMPAVDRLVRELGGVPAELAAVLVGTGPGSYTGLRVGIATALGLARASGARVRGVPSGQVLAFGALDPGQSAYHLIDGRSGGFYLAHFLRTEGEVLVLEAPTVVGREDLPGRLGDLVPILTDDATVATSGLSPEFLERVRTDVRPDARDLLALGLARLERLGPEALDAIEPLYLRPFGARLGD
ncbi:MAG: tRNA (adenosine(37)-N6)-threonylcarbamoyltransferase complex dimerization subunit type 1 TsaB [Planctomycetota bacterium]|nr:tRNA (adenosine(37)-N6)-threonylcarbamoyltransferase complex dimerization subunit type 1 TsaB [Planctomycetota bacterium]